MSNFFRARFFKFILVFVSRDLELRLVRPEKKFSDFNEIWYVHTNR